MDLKDYVETDIDITNADTLQTVDTAPSSTVAAIDHADAEDIDVPKDTDVLLVQFTVPNVAHDVYFIHSAFRAKITEAAVHYVGNSLWALIDGVKYPSADGDHYTLGFTDEYATVDSLITIPKNVQNKLVQIYTRSLRDCFVNYIIVSGWGHSPHIHDHTEYTPLRGQLGGADLGHPH